MAYSFFKTLISKPIFWILIFAFGLRLWGITYGFPLFLVKDEPTLIYGALKMVELKTLIPVLHQDEFRKVLYYPPLTSYFYLVILSPFIAVHYLISGAPPLSHYKDILALNPSFIWIIGRMFNVLLGLMNILTIYLLAKRLFKSERAGLLAALFLSVSFYHLQLSQVIRHWMPATLLIYLIWLLSVDVVRGNASLKKYLGIGVLLGASVGGVNTASMVAAIPFLFAHLLQKNGRTSLQKLAEKKFLLAVIVSLITALTFVLLYPFGFTRAEGAANPQTDIANRFAGLASKNISGLVQFISVYTHLLWRYEAILFIAAVVGIFILKNKNWQLVLTGLTYIFSYFALLYYFFDNPIPRGIIFVLPLMAVFAGYAAERVWEKLTDSGVLRYINVSEYSNALRSYLISSLFLVVLFGFQLATDLRYDWLMSHKDTRLATVDWVTRNIPAGTKILVDSEFLRFTNTKEGIRSLAAIYPSALRIADKTLLSISDSRYPAPAYHILNLWFLSKASREKTVAVPSFFTRQGFRYFIVEHDYADGRDFTTADKMLAKNGRLIAFFGNNASPSAETSLAADGEIATAPLSYLFRIQRLGKFIEIYAL